MTKESLSHPLRVGLYARVSTTNGHQDPELQLSELRVYATRSGWEIAEICTIMACRDRRTPAAQR